MIRDLRIACEKMSGPGAWSLCDQSGRGEVGAPHHCIQLPQEVCRKLLSKPPQKKHEVSDRHEKIDLLHLNAFNPF